MDSTADGERKNQVRKRERQNEEVSPHHQETHRQDTCKTWRNARKEKWYSLLHHRNKETLNDVAKKTVYKKAPTYPLFYCGITKCRFREITHPLLFFCVSSQTE